MEFPFRQRQHVFRIHLETTHMDHARTADILCISGSHFDHDVHNDDALQLLPTNNIVWNVYILDGLCGRHFLLRVPSSHPRGSSVQLSHLEANQETNDGC